MATLDPSIPLGVRPVQIETPMNALAQAFQMQAAQQQNALAAMKMDAVRREQEDQTAIRTGLAAPGAKPAEVLLRHGRPKEAAEWSASQRTAQREDLEISLKRIGLGAQLLSTAKDQPSYDAARQAAKSSGLDVSQFPEQFDPNFVQSRLTQSLTIKDQLEQKWKEMDFGLRQQTFGETQRHHRATEGQQAADLEYRRTQPQLTPLDTAGGPVLVDRRTGTSTPVVGQNGQPVGPKLKDAPTGAQSAFLENRQNLGRAERALALLEGKNLGDPAQGGARGDANATGLKGYLPNQVLNRMDPEGVDTRAAIADLGSLVIHSRSGAAVTAAEFPRLAPFIPTEKDDPETAKKKVRRFIQIYREENQALQDSYNPDTGYRPIGGGAPAASPPAPANPRLNAPTPEGSWDTPKTMSLADVQATARASGKTVEEVKAAARARGFTIR